MTEHVEGWITTARGRKLYWQGWTSGEPVKGVVAIAHGLHEHSARYEYVAERLVAAGYPVYAIDHAGHGRSDGKRGDLSPLSDVVDGIDKLITLVAERHPGVPRFLLGHSAGGLFALLYATGSPQGLGGLILSAPAVDISIVTPVQRKVLKALARVAPQLPMIRLDSNLVSRDPDVVHYHATNPLMVRGKAKARTAYEGVTGADSIPTRLARLTLPVLVMTGTDDKLVAPAGAKLVADKAASDDVTYREYEGLYHEILNEPEKDKVTADVISWLSAHS